MSAVRQKKVKAESVEVVFESNPEDWWIWECPFCELRTGFTPGLIERDRVETRIDCLECMERYKVVFP